jgi:hypothetical protein
MAGRFVAMLLAGLALGLVAGWAVFSEPQPGDGRPLDAQGRVIQAPETKRRVPMPVPTEVPLPLRLTSDPDERELDDALLISERLMTYAEDRYLSARETLGEPAGASVLTEVRTRFEDRVRKLPGDMARWDVAELQRARADAARDAALAGGLEAGSLTALLEALAEGEEIEDFSLEGDFLDAFVVNRKRGAASHGPAFAAGDDPVFEGLVISFPAGIHTLDERRLRGPRNEPFPTDVTVEGAGMDKTLVRLSNISIRGDVERLTLRDMTIDCENDGLFDLRTGNASLDIARVRIVRFDAGHGGCDIFTGTDGVVLVMSDSEVLGGFGKSPGNGSLVSTGSTGCVARFTNVLFRLVDPEFTDIEHGLFIDCRFEGMTQQRMAGSNGMDFHDCSFGELLPVNYAVADYQCSLNELFPGSVPD